MPTREGWKYAEDLGLDTKAVLENFRDWWKAANGANGVKSDWNATWRLWCRNDQKNGKNLKSESWCAHF